MRASKKVQLKESENSQNYYKQTVIRSSPRAKNKSGWLFYGIPEKNYNQGSHAGNKGYHNGHCQSGNFPQLLISMVLETRKSLSTFLVLFSYCPCDNAINNGRDTNGNGDESDESCRNKSSVRFHVVECRSPIQHTIRFISEGNQFEAVEIRCVDGDGDKPRT